ncbi:MAG: hypothetical protein EON52_27380, partial [Actinomycetales bacterium]
APEAPRRSHAGRAPDAPALGGGGTAGPGDVAVARGGGPVLPGDAPGRPLALPPARERGLPPRPSRGRPVNSVRRVHDHDFADVVLGAATPVVVGFCAGSSAACDDLEPMLDELAAATPGLAVALLDVDQSPRTAVTRWDAAVPTVLAFSGGQLLLALPGTPSTNTILSMVALALPRTPEVAE